MGKIKPDANSNVDCCVGNSEKVMEANFEAQAHGVFLLDAQFNINYSNTAAKKLLSAADGLVLEKNKLLVKRNKGLTALMTYLDDTNPQHNKITKRIARSSGKRAYVLQLVALSKSKEQENRHHSCTAFIMYIADPEVSPEIPSKQLMLLYGLTTREASLAKLLVEGSSVEDITRQLGVTSNTVRTHLRNIFSKTESAGQVDLVRLLLSVPLLKVIHLNES